MINYDDTFFTYVNAGAIRSARGLLPVLLRDMQIRSVLDVGCGQGAWLSVWRDLGVEAVTGIDGNYVDRTRLLFPEQSFKSHNLATEFNLERSFDLVQSLEVAEHLPASSASGFINSLVRHGDLILFSAAPKGQGGDNHLNEQSYDYWRALFARVGYVAIDCLRPKIIYNKEIEPWYRYNTLLYASPVALSSMSVELKDFRVPDNHKVPDISPLPYKIRKTIVRCLPISVMTKLAKFKERRVIRK